jgi:hypothetical protein
VDDGQIDFVWTYIGANPDRIILSKAQQEESVAAARGLKAPPGCGLNECSDPGANSHP